MIALGVGSRAVRDRHRPDRAHSVDTDPAKTADLGEHLVYRRRYICPVELNRVAWDIDVEVDAPGRAVHEVFDQSGAVGLQFRIGGDPRVPWTVTAERTPGQAACRFATRRHVGSKRPV